jgi:DNA polymerase (family 10)
MAALDAAAVAALLVELGRRTALAGDNYFRAKAYLRAADTLSALVEPLDRVIAENRLRQLPRIGETIADIVTRRGRGSAASAHAGTAPCVRLPRHWPTP